jgi:hypothetical protein
MMAVDVIGFRNGKTQRMSLEEWEGDSMHEQKSRWILLGVTSPSGKHQFVCRICGRISSAPDKACPYILSSPSGETTCEELERVGGPYTSQWKRRLGEIARFDYHIEQNTTKCKHGLGDCEVCGTSNERDVLHTTIGGKGRIGNL